MIIEVYHNLDIADAGLSTCREFTKIFEFFIKYGVWSWYLKEKKMVELHDDSPTSIVAATTSNSANTLPALERRAMKAATGAAMTICMASPGCVKQYAQATPKNVKHPHKFEEKGLTINCICEGQGRG